MDKIIIPGFKDTNINNRIIRANEDMLEEVDIGNGNGQIFFLTFKAGIVRDVHSHEEIRVTIVRSGKMKLTYDGREEILNPGDCCTLMPGTKHKLKVLGEESLLLLEMVLPPE